MIIQVLPIVAIFINILLAVFILSQNRKVLSNRLFALLASLGALWIFANLLTDTLVSVFWLETSYSMGALVISTGLIWVLLITEDRLDIKKVRIISLVALFFFIISYKDGFITEYHDQVYSGDIFKGNPGWGLFIYAIFYFSSTFAILFKLWHSLVKTRDIEKKRQFKYVFIGALITLLVTAFSSFVLPQFFSAFILSRLDSVGFLIFLSFIAYSITKHHLFNIKVITIELVTFSFWVFMLIRIFFATSQEEILIETGLLIIAIVMGITLIRSVLHELQQRKKIEALASDLTKAYGNVKDLNEHLEEKVAEQTQEIRASYEVEKKARHELEELAQKKDHFISMAQHQLRTPVTGVKWQLEALLSETSRGDTSHLTKNLETMSSSVEELTSLIGKITDIN